jgi:hypothetical protein
MAKRELTLHEQQQIDTLTELSKSGYDAAFMDFGYKIKKALRQGFKWKASLFNGGSL